MINYGSSTDVIFSQGWGKCFSASLRLAKVRLCLLIALSTLFGAVLGSQTMELSSFVVVLAVFLVAAGSATLNSVQDVEIDSSMSRTAGRPLPMQEITKKYGYYQTLLLWISGFFLLIILCPIITVILTTISVLLYNAVYTPLKKRTIWAILPGAICGTLPPVIGYSVLSREFLSYQLALIVVLLFIWQIPHFYLLVLHYKNEYSNSSVPSLVRHFGEPALQRVCYAWISSLSLIMMLFILLPLGIAPLVRLLIIANSLTLPILTAFWLLNKTEPPYRSIFILLNCTLFIHMSLIISAILLL